MLRARNKGDTINLVMKMEFGQYLTELRESSGFKSQRQLALKAGIAPATLSRVEGGTQKPSPDTLLILSKFLRDVTYEELMERAGYLSSESAAVPTVYPEEAEFSHWVKENVSDVFFYEFDKSPEESKKQLMKDLRYMWERDQEQRKSGKPVEKKPDRGDW